MRFIAFLFALLSFLPAAQAKDNVFTINREFRVKEITVDLKNINDVGLVFVSHADGSLALAGQASFGLSLSGLAGKGEIDLAPFLESGNNFVLFVLWNKQGKTIDTEYYKKTFMDKWSYEISLYGDGTNIFRQADEGTGNTGVVASFFFNVDKRGSGYEVSGATDGQRYKAFTRLNKINITLRDNKNKPAPESTTDIASTVSVALTGGN
jgi:hypothetical protein